MRTQHSVGGGCRPKSLLGDENHSKAKYTDKQFGAGYKPSKDDDMDRSSDGEETVLPPRPRGYVNSPNGRRPRDIFDDDSDDDGENAKESDTQSDDGKDSDLESNSDSESDDCNEAKENDYDVLAWILEDIDENLDIEKRQKQFRKQFAEYIYWIHQFRKQPVYKNVMQTAKELRDGGQGYKLFEAVFKAVKDRKYLLNDVLEKLEEYEENEADDGESTDGESEDDEEENVTYRAGKEFPSVYS